MCECTACGHSEMVHWMFVGCCLVDGCACLGADGLAVRCEPVLHAAEHNSFQERPAPTTHLEYLERMKGRPVTPRERELIVNMKRDGHGSKTIARGTGVNRALVTAVIREVLGPQASEVQVRTRPRQEDRERALEAGITAAEFTAERCEGGRARTIDALDRWIAERTLASAP